MFAGFETVASVEAVPGDAYRGRVGAQSFMVSSEHLDRYAPYSADAYLAQSPRFIDWSYNTRPYLEVACVVRHLAPGDELLQRFIIAYVASTFKREWFVVEPGMRFDYDDEQLSTSLTIEELDEYAPLTIEDWHAGGYRDLVHLSEEYLEVAREAGRNAPYDPARQRCLIADQFRSRGMSWGLES